MKDYLAALHLKANGTTPAIRAKPGWLYGSPAAADVAVPTILGGDVASASLHAGRATNLDSAGGGMALAVFPTIPTWSQSQLSNADEPIRTSNQYAANTTLRADASKAGETQSSLPDPAGGDANLDFTVDRDAALPATIHAAPARSRSQETDAYELILSGNQSTMMYAQQTRILRLFQQHDESRAVSVDQAPESGTTGSIDAFSAERYDQVVPSSTVASFSPLRNTMPSTRQFSQSRDDENSLAASSILADPAIESNPGDKTALGAAIEPSRRMLGDGQRIKALPVAVHLASETRFEGPTSVAIPTEAEARVAAAALKGRGLDMSSPKSSGNIETSPITHGAPAIMHVAPSVVSSPEVTLPSMHQARQSPTTANGDPPHLLADLSERDPQPVVHVNIDRIHIHEQRLAAPTPARRIPTARLGLSEYLDRRFQRGRDE